MQNWLRKEGIPYEDDMLKPELYALIKMSRKPKKYTVYSCLEGTEHEILRLPPYHACFNPIELAWGLVKRYFDAHVGRNHDYSEEMMMTIFEEALATVTPEVWAKICDKIEKRIIEAYETQLKDEDPNNPFQMVISVDHDEDDVDEDDIDDPWETIKKSTRFGQADEQYNSDDPDDPAVIHIEKRGKRKKKLTPVELACGVAFDDILPPGTMPLPSQRQRTKRALFPSKIRRKANLQDEGDEVLAVITEVPEEPHAESPPVSKDTEMLESAPPIEHCKPFSEMDRESEQPVDDNLLHGNEGTQGGDVWYYPVESRAWWMIPARCVPHSELELAVSHIVTNGPGVCENAFYSSTCESNFPEDEIPKYDMILDENQNEVVEVTADTFGALQDKSHIISEQSSALNKVPDIPQKAPPKTNRKEESNSEFKSLQVFSIPSRQVVDKYFTLIKRHYTKNTHSILVYPSTFYKYIIILNKGDASFAQNDNPFAYDVVFIPVELSSLWCLCVLKPRQQTVRFYSAFGEDNHECLEAVLKFLSLEHMRHKGQSINWLGWSAEEVTDLVTDHNVEDSPVLMCLYARRVCEHLPCYFGTDTFHQIRQQMVEELKTGKLMNLILPPGQVRAPRQKSVVTERGSLLLNRERNCIPLSNALRVFGLEEEMDSKNQHWQSPEKKSLEDALKPLSAHEEKGIGDIEQVEVIQSDSDTEDQPVTSQDFSSLPYSEICLLPPNTVVSKFGNWHLTVDDIRLLQPGQWLNDQVINMYLMLLADASAASVHVFPSQFYTKLMQGGHNAVKTWTKKMDIFTFDLLLVPIHLVNHWALIVVNVKEKTVTFYDSMPNRKTMYSNHIFSYLCCESKALQRGGLESRGWSHGNATDIPRQNNVVDCGVFSCSYARCLTQLCDCWLFEQEDMDMIRYTMVQELLGCDIKKITGCTLPQQTLWPAEWKPIMPLQYSVSTVKEAFLIQSGRLHQRMACFPYDRRNTQCTAIATCAIIATSLIKRPFSSLEMDAIVLMGDEVYVQCRTGVKEVKDVWLSPDDISEMGAFTAFRKVFSVKIQYVSGGTYKHKDRCYALSDGLQQEDTEAAHGYLFVGRSSTVSFWLESGGTYLLFNSHCVSKDNVVQECAEMGASRLYRCMTPVAVSRLLFSGTPYDNSAWSLVKVHLS